MIFTLNVNRVLPLLFFFDYINRVTVSCLVVFCYSFFQVVAVFKGIDYCPIEIIKGLTDKGQFSISQI